MATYRSPRQPDLFNPPGLASGGGYGQLEEPPPAEFVERIRNELTATLAKARAAEHMPWKDWTAATLAELRFNGILHWLPTDEAEALRQSFTREMARLWDIAARDHDEEQPSAA